MQIPGRGRASSVLHTAAALEKLVSTGLLLDCALERPEAWGPKSLCRSKDKPEPRFSCSGRERLPLPWPECSDL